MIEPMSERREVEQTEGSGSSTAVAVLDEGLVYLAVNPDFGALMEQPAEQIVGRPLAAFATGWFGRALSQLSFERIRAGEAPGALVIDRDGRRLLISCSLGQMPAQALAYILTVTTLTHILPSEQLLAYAAQLEHSVAAGRREATRNREAATGLRNLLFMSIADRSLEEMLDYVYEQAQRRIGAEGMLVLWANELTTSVQRPEQVDTLYAAGAGVGLAWTLTIDAALLAQLQEKHNAIFLAGTAQEGPGAALLIAPLLVDGNLSGVIIFIVLGALPTPSIQQDAMWLADQVIVAHGADRLQRKAKTASSLHERERLAREMHDAAVQSIYSLTLFAEAGRRLASLGQIDRVQDYLYQLNETAQQALKELRLLLYELQPAVLEQVGLVGALRQRLESVEQRTGMTARLEIDGEISLPAMLEDGLYRICQEALNNALKHASASEVTVYLGIDDGMLHLEICDNGVGFNPDDPRILHGEGFATMRERVRLMHATLSIISEPQKGACVRVLMPISNAVDHISEQVGLPIHGGAQ